MIKKMMFLLAISMAFVSCSSSDQKASINFKLVYDDVPFIFFQDYSYPDGKNFNLTRLSFYISDIQLEDDQGGEFFPETKYIDLTNSHADLSSAQQGYSLEVGTTELKNIKSLMFNIGVPEDLNATTPNDYTSGNDLSRSAEYWMSWNSYIFAKIEGNVDLDSDLVKETGVALHLGSDAALRTVRLDGLDSNENIEIIIDVKKLFQNGGSTFDIAATNRIHSLSQMDQINILMDNLAASMEAQ